MKINLYRPGIVPYRQALRFQQQLQRRVIAGIEPGALVILEHPPTITVGKSGSIDNVLISRQELKKRGIALHFIERGGDVTCHNPGQLVVYPIINLAERGKDARKYISDMEEVLIRTVADFSISGRRDASHAGVWVGNRELAAIGISLRRWISLHGVSLNINNDPVLFSMVNPCGFRDRGAAFMNTYAPGITSEPVTERFLFHFSDVFDADFLEIKEPDFEQETAAVV